MTIEKQEELIDDVMAQQVVSNCCSAKVYSPNNEWYQCMECKEYCDPVSEE